MLKTVINDLRAFLFTLLILIFFFGNALVILGIGIDPTTLMNPEEKATYDLEMQNEEAESESDRRYLKPKGGGGGGGGGEDDDDKSMFEFIGIYPGILTTTLLTAIGDFENALESS